MRKIIHLDMDAFYASVEQRDRPELRGKPVIVGGTRERGVVSACSYEARAFGVRSAMSMARALALCPQAIVLPVRMRLYGEASEQVFDIFARYTDRIEPLSIDEAFLDVTGCERLFGSAREIAERIRAEVRKETALAVSAGVAPNKFLAKLASEAAKPDGLKEIHPAEIDPFLLPLPVSRLWGVGRVTAERLENLGIRTVADLRGVERGRLARILGSAGDHLYQLARGLDDRPVDGAEEVKSIGHEETFERDLYDPEAIRIELLDLSERVARRLRRHRVSGRTLTVKVRYGDFSTVTRSATFSEGLDHGIAIFREAAALVARTEAGTRAVRLLGISLSHLQSGGAGQQQLFGVEDRERKSSLDRAVDLLGERFGGGAVCRGDLLERRRGSAEKGADSEE